MIRAIVLLVILSFCFLNLNAQKDSNIQLKIEAGLLWALDGEGSGLLTVDDLGLFFCIEPTVKISKNTSIGLRIGTALNTQKIINHNPLEYNLYRNISTGLFQFMDVDNSIVSFVPAFNYRFIGEKVRPYLSVGVGYYFLTNYTSVSEIGAANPSRDLIKVNTQNQIGFLIRGGLGFGNIIVGLEFNYIPKADVEIPNGQVIGTVNNSYVGLSIGYVFGVGGVSK